MKPIPIKRTIEKVPGGMMVLPLFFGALIVTFFPHAGAFFGSFTGALFTGALPILAVFYLCMGAMIDVHALPQVARRGGLLLATKTFLGVAAGFIFGRRLGMEPVRSGWWTGISTLAIVAAINDTNGGLYMSLTGQYGTPQEAAAYSVMALESGPFLTMITLGAAGLSAFPWPTLLGAILPLLTGMLLGNLDPDLRKFFSTAAPVLIPFYAFALGATLDLHRVWEAGLVGIALGLGVILVSAPVLLLVDRLSGGRGTAGIAAATTASNAAAVPALVAAANPNYADAAGHRHRPRRLLRNRHQPPSPPPHRLVGPPRSPATRRKRIKSYAVMSNRALKNRRHRTRIGIVAAALIISTPTHPQKAAPPLHPSFEILTHRMDVDVDGAPNAYGPPGKPALDILLHAHSLEREDKEIVGYLTDAKGKPSSRAPTTPSPATTSPRPPSPTTTTPTSATPAATSTPATSTTSSAATKPSAAASRSATS